MIQLTRKKYYLTRRGIEPPSPMLISTELCEKKNFENKVAVDNVDIKTPTDFLQITLHCGFLEH